MSVVQAAHQQQVLTVAEAVELQMQAVAAVLLISE
jgi:hypothetical protein